MMMMMRHRLQRRKRDATMKLITGVLWTCAGAFAVIGLLYLWAGDRQLGGGFIISALVLLITDVLLVRGTGRGGKR